MYGNTWEPQDSGLALREDESSWQGSYELDMRFYLRRDKVDPKKVTDLIFGNLNEATSARYLAEFLDKTGGIQHDKLVFTDIGRFGGAHAQTISNYDKTIVVAKRAVGMTQHIVTNCLLEPDGPIWNAVLLLDGRTQ